MLFKLVGEAFAAKEDGSGGAETVSDSPLCHFTRYAFDFRERYPSCPLSLLPLENLPVLTAYPPPTKKIDDCRGFFFSNKHIATPFSSRHVRPKVGDSRDAYESTGA